jgi:hypothetical protein
MEIECLANFIWSLKNARQSDLGATPGLLAIAD